VTSAVSNFKKFIEWLESSGIPYFVPWGYEGLPEQIHGGDVDMFVLPGFYERVEENLVRLGYSVARCPIYSDRHRHAQFSRMDDYTIHLSDSFCFNFKGKYLLLNIDGEDLMGRAVRHDGWLWVADSVLELALTVLRIMGGRLDCMTRLKKFLEEIK
jgi:hypothetical protein